MASRDINKLENNFKEKVINTLNCCKESGFLLKPFCTIRTPKEQAELWRRSRNVTEINRVIKMLENENADWIANVIKEVGPQYGKKVTNALPGQSWHQWGLAIDCFYSVDGAAFWDSSNKGYLIYAHQAIINGLSAGHFWSNFRDSVHIQLLDNRVTDFYSWKDINDLMEEKYKDS